MNARLPLPAAVIAAAAAALVAYPLGWLGYMFMEYINASPARLIKGWHPTSEDFLWWSLRIPLPLMLLAAIGTFGILRQPAERWTRSLQRARRFMILAVCSCAVMVVLFAAGTIASIDDIDAKIATLLLLCIVASVVITYPLDRNVPATICLLIAAIPLWLAGVVAIRVLYVGVLVMVRVVVRSFS